MIVDMNAWSAARDRNRRKAAAIDEARNAKAAPYIRHLDAAIQKFVIAHTPNQRASQYALAAAHVAHELRSYGDFQWFRLMRELGLSRRTSPETRAIVIDYFDWAARNPVIVEVV